MNKRSAIIIADPFNGFFKHNPALPDPLDFKPLFATVGRVIDAGRDDGVNIVFIKGGLIEIDLIASMPL